MRARPVSATAFAVNGGRTEDYPAGRRLRLDHGAGSVVELGVVSAVFTGDVTTVTFERLGTAPRPHALPAASGWTAIAQHVHGLAALFDLPGLALDQARRELETSGHTFETGTVGFPFFHSLAFRVGR